MIERLVTLCFRRRGIAWIVFAFVALYGWTCWKQLPIEAYPDIADVTSQAKFLKKVGDKNFALSNYIIKSTADPETLGYGIGVGINQKNTELKQKVDAALCKLINDGTVKTASLKWFEVDISNYDACKK